MPTVADDVDERPLICNAFSVNGILDGRKTQTRRIAGQDFRMQKAERVNRCSDYTFDFIFEDDTGMLRESPYGEPGDILWVREAFRLPEHVDGEYTPKEYVSSSSKFAYPHVRYEADGEWDNGLAAQSEQPEWGRKRPSIHMPRELCRLRLRVEGVRVERVQDIGQEDILAEGIRGSAGFSPSGTGPYSPEEQYQNHQFQRWKHKWNEIHGDGAWEENPWVWCISFTRIDDDR